MKIPKKKFGGGRGGERGPVGGCQGGCDRRNEVFGKIHKKKKNQGGSVWGGSGWGGGGGGSGWM